MNISHERPDSPASAVQLSLGMLITGALAFLLTFALAARLIWEETVWTWERGPQMVGFSLAHGSGALLFLSPLLLATWIVLAVILIVRTLFKGKRVSSTTWIALSAAISLLLVMGLPEGVWQTMFIGRMASSPRAGDLLMHAAARGEIVTVKAFVSHGAPVDATDKAYRRTALHGAASKGDIRIIRYLISRNANVNALDRYGDSPLELAASNGHDEASRLLADHGAKRMRGDEAQRQKAIDDVVREEIEQMNHVH